MRRPPLPLLVLLGALALSACATPAPWPASRVLIFGEQHDQPDQQRQVAAAVVQLASERRLAALVIEMAERGRSTAALPRDADERSVQAALAWTGWDWAGYGRVVMAAVRAGVPVLGGNLPRAQTRPAMEDASLDATVAPAVRERLAVAVRDGHCGLLPRHREPAMVRVQIARDRSMAAAVVDTLAEAPSGQTVLLLTGAQHAARDRGVPLHLPDDSRLRGDALRVLIFEPAPPELRADQRLPARHLAKPDPCEGLGERLRAPASPASVPASAPA